MQDKNMPIIKGVHEKKIEGEVTTIPCLRFY